MASKDVLSSHPIRIILERSSGEKSANLAFSDFVIPNVLRLLSKCFLRCDYTLVYSQQLLQIV